jgi:hypothetical protein
MRSGRFLVALTVANLLLMIGVWAGALGGIGGAGPPDPDVVRGREVQLVNDAGQVVGQLYTGDDGSGQLRLRDASGTVRVKLGVGEDGGSGLVLFDGAAEPTPGVTASAGHARSRIVVSDADGGRRVIRP